MKIRLVLFLFLLMFIRCGESDQRSLTILPGDSSLTGFRKAPLHQPAGPAVKDTSGITLIPGRADASREKTHRRGGRVPELLPSPQPGKKRDSLNINRLNSIRSRGIEPDLNEPVSRDFLFSESRNPFPPVVVLGQERYLFVNFDNDILDYTDRFYTNGIRIDLIAPGLRLNPVARLLAPYRGSGRNYYGLTMVQNMYTPSTTKTGGILYGDRPYAAYLYLGTYKITLDPARHFRQTSELDLGIIGPQSYGEWVQRTFHENVPTNSKPLGWEYQIRNDLVLNYMVRMEKGLVNHPNMELLVIAGGKAGTLYTNLDGGFHFRTGWMDPYFSGIGPAKRGSGNRNFRFVFFLKGTGRLVGYDATLQGGLFNRTSVYTLPASEISRFVFEGSSGVSVSLHGFRLDVEQFLLSPEFHNGWWHKWVHAALVFCL